jgi:hypothetical protein
MLIQIAKRLFSIFSWTEKPEKVSAPFKKTKFRRGEHTKLVWLNKDIKSYKNPILIGLGIINTSYIRDKSQITASLSSETITVEYCIDALENSISLPLFGEIEKSFNDSAFKLDLAITEMSPGSQFIRWFAILGMGHAWVQIEAILSDVNGNSVVKLVDRRRHSELRGVKQAFLGETGPNLVTKLINEISINIVSEIRYCFEGADT